MIIAVPAARLDSLAEVTPLSNSRPVVVHHPEHEVASPAMSDTERQQFEREGR
jgi:hypothetical protein